MPRTANQGAPAPGTALRRLGNRAWQAGTLTLAVHLLIIAVLGAVSFQADFNGDLYLAGLRITHGISPYLPGMLQHQANLVLAGGTFIPSPSPRYPAPVLLASVPLSLLPIQLAQIIFMTLSVGAVFAALRLVGVRDWRCVLVAMVSPPVVTGVLVGNLSPILILGVALTWRYRARLLVPALALAGLVVAKVFLWPLGLWMLITKRRKMLALASLAATAAVLAAWAAIGFAGFTEYPRLLLNVATVGEGRGSSFVALLVSIGFGGQLARSIALACGLALVMVAWRISRRPGCERNAFGLVVMAALTACPVVWGHYLVLLFIPIALLSPGFSSLWFLPMLSALAPGEAVHAYGWGTAAPLLGELVLIISLSRPLLSTARVGYWRERVAIARAAAPS